MLDSEPNHGQFDRPPAALASAPLGGLPSRNLRRKLALNARLDSPGEVMNVAERTVGHCVIHAAALDATASSGYHAAVVVTCTYDNRHERDEVFRDERLEDGRVWRSPDEAIAHALAIGEAAASTHEAFGTFSISDWLASPG
jgi:hypothetical protein